MKFQRSIGIPAPFSAARDDAFAIPRARDLLCHKGQSRDSTLKRLLPVVGWLSSRRCLVVVRICVQFNETLPYPPPYPPLEVFAWSIRISSNITLLCVKSLGSTPGGRL